MELKQAFINDILTLQAVCTKSYTEIFANHWMNDGLELYLEQEFSTNRLKEQLVDTDIKYFFIQEKGETSDF